MSEVDFSSLPISKMRSTLKSLGLSGAGTKSSLIERYQAYQNGEIVADMTEQGEKAESVDQNQENLEVTPDEANVNLESTELFNKVSALDTNANATGEAAPDENKAEELPMNEEVPQGVPTTEFDQQQSDMAQVAGVDEASAPVTQETELMPEEKQLIESAEAVTATAAPTESTEAIEGSVAPAASAAPTEPTANAVVAPTEPSTTAAAAVPAEPAESFDIEAELNKREARSKKFGTTFDREACRQQLLRAHSAPTPQPVATAGAPLDQDVSFRFSTNPQRAKRFSERRAKFGAVERSQSAGRRADPIVPQEDSISAELRAEREKKFGVVEPSRTAGRRQGRAGQGMDAMSPELRAEREKKFGVVEQTSFTRQRGEKRYRSNFRNRKNRRFM